MSAVSRAPDGRRTRFVQNLRGVTPSLWGLTAVVMAVLYSWFAGYVLTVTLSARLAGR